MGNGEGCGLHTDKPKHDYCQVYASNGVGRCRCVQETVSPGCPCSGRADEIHQIVARHTVRVDPSPVIGDHEQRISPGRLE